MLLGVVAGIFGAALVRSQVFGAAQAVLAVVAGILMVLAGLQVAGVMKELADRQKRRSTRTQRDTLDLALTDLAGFYRDVLPYPPHMQLSLGVLVHLKPALVSPLVEAAVSFGQQCGRFVNGRIGRMGEQIASQEPLHHTADARPDLEDAQGLLRGRSWQSRYQVLPDLPIQRPVVYALLGREVTQ